VYQERCLRGGKEKSSVEARAGTEGADIAVTMRNGSYSGGRKERFYLAPPRKVALYFRIQGCGICFRSLGFGAQGHDWPERTGGSARLFRVAAIKPSCRNFFSGGGGTHLKRLCEQKRGS